MTGTDRISQPASRVLIITGSGRECTQGAPKPGTRRKRAPVSCSMIARGRESAHAETPCFSLKSTIVFNGNAHSCGALSSSARHWQHHGHARGISLSVQTPTDSNQSSRKDSPKLSCASIITVLSSPVSVSEVFPVLGIRLCNGALASSSSTSIMFGILAFRSNCG